MLLSLLFLLPINKCQTLLHILCILAAFQSTNRPTDQQQTIASLNQANFDKSKRKSIRLVSFRSHFFSSLYLSPRIPVVVVVGCPWPLLSSVHLSCLFDVPQHRHLAWTRRRRAGNHVAFVSYSTGVTGFGRRRR